MPRHEAAPVLWEAVAVGERLRRAWCPWVRRGRRRCPTGLDAARRHASMAAVPQLAVRLSQALDDDERRRVGLGSTRTRQWWIRSRAGSASSSSTFTLRTASLDRRAPRLRPEGIQHTPPRAAPRRRRRPPSPLRLEAEEEWRGGIAPEAEAGRGRAADLVCDRLRPRDPGLAASRSASSAREKEPREEADADWQHVKPPSSQRSGAKAPRSASARPRAAEVAAAAVAPWRTTPRPRPGRGRSRGGRAVEQGASGGCGQLGARGRHHRRVVTVTHAASQVPARAAEQAGDALGVSGLARRALPPQRCNSVVAFVCHGRQRACRRADGHRGDPTPRCSARPHALLREGFRGCAHESSADARRTAQVLHPLRPRSTTPPARPSRDEHASGGPGATGGRSRQPVSASRSAGAHMARRRHAWRANACRPPCRLLQAARALALARTPAGAAGGRRQASAAAQRERGARRGQWTGPLGSMRPASHHDVIGRVVAGIGAGAIAGAFGRPSGMPRRGHGAHCGDASGAWQMASAWFAARCGASGARTRRRRRVSGHPVAAHNGICLPDAAPTTCRDPRRLRANDHEDPL